MPAEPVPEISQVETAGGLKTVILDTPQGQIRLNFPDDLQRGDTISGSVITVPKGNASDEKAKNQTELQGYVINFEGTKIKVAQPVFTCPLLNPTNTLTAPKTTLPNVTTPSPNDFHLPTIGQQGRLTEVFGPFNGNSSNTILNWSAISSEVTDFPTNTENVSGGFSLIDGKPIAESPRKAVFQCPTNVAGPIRITLTEGNTKATGTFRNVGVNLSAPKTNLVKGERTTLTIQVTGLQGIKEPVPLKLESHGVITMEGGMYQQFMIQPSQVSADGRYSTTRGITGVQTGAWGATATVVTQR